MKLFKIKIRFVSIYKFCRHRTKWSVRLRYPLRSIKRDLYSFIPSYKRLWNGSLIYFGVKHMYIEIDKRNINNIEDFVAEMKSPRKITKCGKGHAL